MIAVALFDVALVATLAVCAWFALTASDLLRSVVLFIAFGLLVALAWVRLNAPDVALAEAAVGSGLTGALLLSTLSAMQRAQANDAGGDKHAAGKPTVRDGKGADRA